MPSSIRPYEDMMNAINMTSGALPTATSTSAASEEVGQPGDFLQMIGQLSLPATSPASTAPTQLASQAALQQELERLRDGEETDLAAFFALLPQANAQVVAVPKLDALQHGGLDSVSGLMGRLGAQAQSAPQTLLSQAESVATADSAPEMLTLASNVESAAARSTSPAAPEVRSLQTPVGSQAWADELGGRLTLMTEQGKQTASLRLSPEHLGPLEVKISVTDDKATVWFGAAHADTRAALEQALPRLRELFLAQGMSLTDAGVFHESPREQSATPTPLVTNVADTDAEEAVETTVTPLNVSLVDAYA